MNLATLSKHPHANSNQLMIIVYKDPPLDPIKEYDMCLSAQINNA